ncbi:hypothetical protein CPTAKMNP4_254 [Salmonella phage vB_SenM-AKM_NP4]|uniref:Anti-restriction nuclease n=3 Tax=Gelderlandvirus TaxID=1913653 RepID=M1EAC1_BPS16|nr:hypothetical protein I133_gp012 [Salmonella phage vB_SenM-S16]YP_009147981.1 hypothetical protein ACQ31_gp056 [Salmonella phage STML-198]YP_009615737.1 hypothetical protein FDI73_gp139 [Salmonella phage Melville]WDR21919.1 anti-restriction nuclease [Salmonella phage vB_SenM_UTK0003]WLI71876.1 hypothetical protein CPTAKMNP4_254 [Salmonella phage vB_SenM-AKM_NP4]AEO97176.1 hypothetical protein [Salmonella phage vB_SenM-S16]AFU63939.1 hypothetical protein [Salmonella phage STML-198]ATN93225.
MNRFAIMNELQRCVEPTSEGWDIWYHGAYLGTIVKVKAGKYLIVRDSSVNPLGERTNFMAAISSFVPAACEVYKADYKELQESQPVIRSYGVNKAVQKSLWMRIKMWFK